MVSQRIKLLGAFVGIVSVIAGINCLKYKYFDNSDVRMENEVKCLLEQRRKNEEEKNS